MPITSLNKPIDPADATEVIYAIGLEQPCGGGTLYVSRDEIDEYNRDPDRYAAREFGFATVDDYREWVDCNGAALCSERTKSGRLCRASIGMQYTPQLWREHHRSRPCCIHAKDEGYVSRSVIARARRPPVSLAPDNRRCAAIATGTQDRCAHGALWFRDGRLVCRQHFEMSEVQYAPGCGDRVGAYRAAMAKALGDAP